VNAERVIEQIESTGGKLILIDGGLKGKNLTSTTRKLAKDHKVEIIQFLTKPPIEPLLKPCPICKGRDFIHGHRGGYFCITCQPNVRPGIQVRTEKGVSVKTKPPEQHQGRS